MVAVQYTATRLYAGHATTQKQLHLYYIAWQIPTLLHRIPDLHLARYHMVLPAWVQRCGI